MEAYVNSDVDEVKELRSWSSKESGYYIGRDKGSSTVRNANDVSIQINRATACRHAADISRYNGIVDLGDDAFQRSGVVLVELAEDRVMGRYRTRQRREAGAEDADQDRTFEFGSHRSTVFGSRNSRGRRRSARSR